MFILRRFALFLIHLPAFAFSEFERFGGLFFHFDVFCITESFGFELLALPSVGLFFDWRLSKNNLKRIKKKHAYFFEVFFCADETGKSIPILCSINWQERYLFRPKDLDAYAAKYCEFSLAVYTSSVYCFMLLPMVLVVLSNV